MTTKSQGLSARATSRGRHWFWVAGFLLFSPPLVRGHDILGTCIQHAVHLSVEANGAELTLDLTFFEEWSTRERAAMDADGNGTITRAEQEAYLKRLAPRVCKEIRLRMSGREVPLIPLYGPELDLFANFKTGPAHYRLRLFFFVDTPLTLGAGDEIVVEDQLWPDARIMVTADAESRDGCCRVIAVPAKDNANPEAKTQERRLVRFQCLAQTAPHPGEAAPGSGKPMPALSDSHQNVNP